MDDRYKPLPTESSLHFRDVVVAPYSDLLDYTRGGYDHRGGPNWPDWDSQTVARHQRGGSPIDFQPLPCQVEERIAGPLAWAGPITRHFGHQLADFSMRIIPTLAANSECVVAFSSQPKKFRWQTLSETPGFFREMLDWVGLPPSRVTLITKPTLVEHLFVLPQAEQHYGPGPAEGHLDRMDELVDRRLPHLAVKDDVLFVSRAGMHAHLAGERYLEQVMADAGARIMRPEMFPLAQQLEAYASAEHLVFSQGSAVHGARLLGRSLKDVFIIVRIEGDPIAEAALAPRSRGLTYRSALVGVVHGLLASDGEPLEVTGMPVPDVHILKNQLSEVLPMLRRRLDINAYHAARDADVLAWFERSLRSPMVHSAESWKHMLSSLGDCGLHHLVSKAKSLIDQHPDPPKD